VGERVIKFWSAVHEDQSPTAETSALRGEHALGTAFRDRDFRGDGVVPVLQVRRGALGDANGAGVVGELGAAARQAWSNGNIHALGSRGVKGIDVVLLRLTVEDRLKL